MSDDKNPIETAVDQALDAFVYAPIGLVFDGPALFPKLVERGRNQVQVARMMGKMAVQMGQGEAEKRIASTEGPIRDVFVAMGVVAPEEPAPAPTPTVASTPSTKSSAKRAPRPAKKAAKRAGPTAKASEAAAAQAAPASSLGIADYDSLSASQVVKRLRGMDASDLDAVQAYEAATRARKTILNRIAQLQKG